MTRLGLVLVLVLAPPVAKEIGDECSSSLDCGDGNGTRPASATSSRPAAIAPSSAATGTPAPDEAVCVRFYSASFTNKPCVLATEDLTTDDCTTFDEVCTLRGQCVPRASEIRYCMRTCGAARATVATATSAATSPDDVARRRASAEAGRAPGSAPGFCAPAPG
ncbi:MAG: hypothetical protein IPL61_29090 [Myxococcales bacterium]|nr:hypothetical protein [Myxococcales bacterium]